MSITHKQECIIQNHPESVIYIQKEELNGGGIWLFRKKNESETSLSVAQTINNNLVVILLFIGISARVVLFGSIPPGLNQDEASVGYDAYAILNYGIDRNGIHNPVHLIAWGSGQSALYAYFAMPFIALLGLSVIAIRAVNLTFGIISLFIFYFLVKRVSNMHVALLSLFLLAISPWHIMISRWALDANLFPAIFLTAVFLLVVSFEDKRILPASLFVFALSLYAYTTSFLIVPIFLLIVFSYLQYHKKLNFKSLGIGLLVFIFTALPIFLFVVINYFKMNPIDTALFSIPRFPGSARYMDSSLFSGDFLSDSYKNFVTMIKIIITQSDGLIWNSIPRYGYMFLFSLPFLIVGFVKLTSESITLKKTKRFEKSFVFLVWTIVSFLLGFLIYPNFNRINIVFIPLIFTTAVGIYYIAQRIRYFIIPIIILYLISFSMFSLHYFSTYPQEIEQNFYESFGEAINYASENPNAKIYVTNQVNMPYIYVLFYQKIDPVTFNSSVRYRNPGSGFQFVKSFDRYDFEINDLNKFENSVYVIHNSEEEKFDKNSFVFKRFKYYSVVTKR